MKTCNTCKINLPLNCFYKGIGTFGLEPKCKQCKSFYQKEHLAKTENKSRRSEYYKQKNKNQSIVRSHVCNSCHVVFHTNTSPNKTGNCRKCSKKIASKIWTQNNLAKKAANRAKRRAMQLQATPPWLTSQQLEEIKEFYYLAKELQWLSNPTDPLEVDHIIPLQGVNVCGLHVPWNLQIIPKSLNCSKGIKQ
jgi:hypothetical protein